MICQPKLTETFYEYEVELGNGPLGIFIPFSRHFEFEDFIAEIAELTESILRKIVIIFGGKIL